jgi:signal transduction histidine kinase
MTESGLTPRVEKKDARELYPYLLQIPIFAQLRPEDLDCLEELELVEANAGTELIHREDPNRAYWAVISGEVCGEKMETDGSRTLVGVLGAGETFGEVPLLAGRSPRVICTTTKPSRLIRLGEDTFWKLMFRCPEVRRSVLGTMAERLQAYQAQAAHREKLISLGTLAAGLMHELNNPGAAAKRAASQMRENLTRLQHLSLRFSAESLTPLQLECIRQLQDQALSSVRPEAVSTMEEADAEEALLQWLEAAGVENAWKMAPTFNASGLNSVSLECARSAFDPAKFSDALNWLDALVSSVQLLGTIEESITRVSELVGAVKKYSRQDEAAVHEVDLHDSIQSALTILAHKFRQKELRVEKDFKAELAKLTTRGTGLGQVWTNLLDNAIDASPQKGVITIRTWNDDARVCVSVADRGGGIPKENWGEVFEPFFTTKPIGEGTGLGLDIVHRIVTGKFRGEINFQSSPEGTEFFVRLPIVS